MNKMNQFMDSSFFNKMKAAKKRFANDLNGTLEGVQELIQALKVSNLYEMIFLICIRTRKFL